MTYLLDTHTFLWLSTAPEALSPTIARIVENRENILRLSIVSIWEMQIKIQLGKLSLLPDLQTFVEKEFSQNALVLLNLELRHVWELSRLPVLRKDPFDRALIAQAKAEQLILLSKDARIQQYDVQTLW